jgi:two-component sensor histidine kinase
VTLEWAVDREGERDRLRLVWRERNGPAVAPPSRRGFGSRMIERALAAELQGKVALSFEPEGLVCALEASLPAPKA